MNLGAKKSRMLLTKRVVSKSENVDEKFTKPASVFTIMLRKIYKTSEAIYHNTRNGKLKLFSFGIVLKNPENPLFTIRVRSVFAELEPKNRALSLKLKPVLFRI